MVLVQWLLYLQLRNFDLKVYLTLFYFKSRSVVYICNIVQSTHTAVIDSQLLKQHHLSNTCGYLPWQIFPLWYIFVSFLIDLNTDVPNDGLAPGWVLLLTFDSMWSERFRRMYNVVALQGQETRTWDSYLVLRCVYLHSSSIVSAKENLPMNNETLSSYKTKMLSLSSNSTRVSWWTAKNVNVVF